MTNACEHIWAVLQSEEMGDMRTGMWYFTHCDVTFYCTRCLSRKTEAVSPFYTRSILTHNTNAITRPDE